MTTKIYGTSDDLIEIEGEVTGEVGTFGSDKRPALVMCSDGTVLKMRYAPDDKAIWKIDVLEKGALFERLEICTDEDETPYSDVAYFSDGLKYAYVATGEWEKAQ